MHHTTTLRTHRKQWALKQRHVAHLTGFKSRSSIADLEDGRSFEGLHPALAFEFVFGVTLRELFPKTALEVEDQVIGRALAIEEEHREASDAAAERIRELLQALIARASNQLPL